MIEKVMTVKEVASALRISASTAYALVRKGEIRSIRPTRGIIRIPESAVRDWIDRFSDKALID